MWDPPGRMILSEQEVQEARDNFVAWLKWHQRRPDRNGPPLTDAELGAKVGVSGPTISTWFKTGSARTPSFANLLAAAKLVEVSLDTMVTRRPREPDVALPRAAEPPTQYAAKKPAKKK